VIDWRMTLRAAMQINAILACQAVSQPAGLYRKIWLVIDPNYSLSGAAAEGSAQLRHTSCVCQCLPVLPYW